jgi:putative molybdopterin biosynthesis protein
MAPSVDAALATWLAACAATPVEAEEIAVERAAGRVTAVGVAARWSSPAFACAAMDGIAVRAADTAAAPVVLGHDRFDEIDTGDPLPDGRDVVVMREHVVREQTGESPCAHWRGPGSTCGRSARTCRPGRRCCS